MSEEIKCNCGSWCKNKRGWALHYSRNKHISARDKHFIVRIMNYGIDLKNKKAIDAYMVSK
jgi:hypothetical protein